MGIPDEQRSAHGHRIQTPDALLALQVQKKSQTCGHFLFYAITNQVQGERHIVFFPPLLFAVNLEFIPLMFLKIVESIRKLVNEWEKEEAGNTIGNRMSKIEDELTEHDKLKAPCGQMYEHYKSWADKNGEYQMTSTEFKGRMEQRYGDAGRSGEGKFWKGVGITILSEKDKWMLEEKTVEEMVSAIQ